MRVQQRVLRVAQRRAVLGRHQPALLQAGDGLGDARVRHAEPTRDIGGTRLAGRIDQVGDQLHIILGHRRLQRRPGLSMVIGLLFGRLANFVNGELWGKGTDVPWAIVFPHGGPVPRHPSQLYEAFFEGIILFCILAFAFWKTKARYKPGMLVGLFVFFYGVFRFGVEYFREADAQLMEFAAELTRCASPGRLCRTATTVLT